MKKLKILHLNNVAQIGPILKSQQMISGHTSEFIDLIKPFKKSNLFAKAISFPIRIAQAFYLRIKIFFSNYDIIHIHYTTGALLFLGIKPKLVIHVHGSDVRDKQFQRFHFWINKLIFHYADLVFYSTPDLKRHIEVYNIKATFIPNPLDIENFQETNLPSINSIFIHAAISQIKGAEIFLPALKEAKKKFPQLEISHLNYGDMLQEIIKLNFSILPWIKRDRLKEVISKSGLVLGQFKVGAIGMSELEALACKRPVVCHFEYDDAYPTPPPFIKAKTSEEIFQIIEQYTKDSEIFLKDKEKYREWVIENHSKEKIERLVYRHYLTLF